MLRFFGYFAIVFGFLRMLHLYLFGIVPPDRSLSLAVFLVAHAFGTGIALLWLSRGDNMNKLG
ncbi:MAG: hypothetical protein A2651_02790 [Candidatus Yanofskybacteria bacterium RIFCSPHIGHO2_01_FULL_42_12]|uniref:Uncharacterized protein n=1 Tax=Candidatus Yanofskybacteria bacterium RIFCSPLOWO2_01_FULL_42_49 TaxID=1802694 RepID=A0A1F8GAA5_9BACT|nr:MAG: hypothetical protein A2651_02790 [Candidatus Yanofskybacteria bacterium RIFCSPHIGHO2_01_FULL_42_12]OGN22221.1 MAG: hypothetical protein A2918_02425 [Candidatus Yanofskybacteria bacterium RIFCSPLOWO2_01_FULL_42_49]